MDDSNLFDTGELSARVQSYPRNGRHAPHAHERASIGILLGGSLLERVGPATCQGALGAAIIKPAGVVHEDEFGRRGTVILSLGGSQVESLASRGWEWRRGQRALSHAIASVRHARAGRAIACEEALYLMLLAIGHEAGGSDAGSRQPAWLHAAAALLRRRRSPLRICDVASQIGVHPVHLTRVFRRHFGTSISMYIRSVRVAEAAELLRVSNQRVCDIATELGFFDQSHLCRVFNAECGISPSEYRSLHFNR